VISQTKASRIVEALQTANVRCVFGLPGTQTVELFEALRQRGLRTVVATNELSAAFMAGGWARVTGEPGVLLTIPGPGFTWALTGIAEARLDSVPLLHISGSPATHPRSQRFRQQEIDQVAIAGPLLKGVINADLYPDPGVAVLEGLCLAQSGEPGPVLLQVSSAALGVDYAKGPLKPLAVPSVNPEGLAAFCARVHHARRPIFMFGQGTNGCSEHLLDLVERMNAPVLTTPSARGVISENHPLNLGFDPFAASTSDVNELIASSDLIVVIGCKLSHSGTSGFELDLPADRLVHVDASSEVVGANYATSLAIVADAGEVVRALLESSPPRTSWTDAELETWRSRMGERKTRPHEPRLAGTPAGDPRAFFRALRRALSNESILVLDSGVHQILARRYYRVLARRGLITPTDLQSMGFAIPTAIGARIADPKRPVVALVGDGGFAMSSMELLSAVREGLSLVVIVFVDGAFGQIRLQQLARYGVAHGVALKTPDLGLLSTAIGAYHEVVGDDDAESVIRGALGRSGVSIVEVRMGDTLAIRRSAAIARAREVTRRVAGPRIFRRMKNFFRSRH